MPAAIGLGFRYLCGKLPTGQGLGPTAGMPEPSSRFQQLSQQEWAKVNASFNY